MLGGNFAQIVPAIKQGNGFNVIEVLLQQSYSRNFAVASAFLEHGTSRKILNNDYAVFLRGLK